MTLLTSGREYYIYRIDNDAGNTIYVGSTEDLKCRAGRHMSGKNDKWGINYTFHHIDTVLTNDRNCCNAREQYWINHHQSKHLLNKKKVAGWVWEPHNRHQPNQLLIRNHP